MADRYQARPFRAEDDVRAHRQTPPQGGEGDPLAELARLIGQTDPFSNFGREGRESHARPPAAPHGGFDRAGPDFETNPGPPSWMQHVAQREAPPQNYGGLPHAGQQTYPEERATVSPGHGGYSPPRYDEPPYGQLPDATRYDDVLYGASNQVHDPHHEAYGRAAYQQDIYDRQHHGDENIEQYARQQRGGRTMVVVVLILAFIGTAAAYVYRTFNGSPRAGETPIIRANAGPNKIIPPIKSGEGAGKLIQDRVATGPGLERIISREEQPVDVNTTKEGAHIADPRNAASISAAPSPAAANGTLGSDAPRKIRTLSIRPDRTETPSPAATPDDKVAPSVSNARAAVSTAPVATRTPLSLTPQAAPAAPVRTASASPTATASVASAGGYLVQISSQRSEADAQASYRALKSKYPGVLGSRSPLIKRADLGEKGVYYRAMVGPFGTPDEASQFCSNLKNAGGQCIVQRN